VTEELVQETIQQADAEPFSVVGGDEPTPARKSKKKRRSDHLGYLEQELRTALGTKVEIKSTAKGSGRMVIHFKSVEEFERIRRQLSDAGLAGPREQAG
jgi:ParB family chromosome partitioning protein